DWTALTQAIADGKDAIDNATTIDGVTTEKNTAIEAVNAIKTKAEKAAEALAAAKTAAKADLDTLLGEKTEADYDADDWTTLTQAITDGKDAIDNATTIDGVTTEKNAAIEAVNAVKTKAEKVEDTINALPDFSDVTTANKDAIEAARAAYNALTDAQKAQVSANTLKKLTDAEDKLGIVQVMSEVSAKTGDGMTYTGNPIQLINTPTTALPAGYTMKYAVTTENVKPTDEKLYTTSIPAKTDAGTYYVWYKVVGDENHNDVEPKCLVVTINEKQQTSNGTISTTGIYCASNYPAIQAGMVIEKSNEEDTVEYRWVACDTREPLNWFEVSPWTKDNNWMNWEPEKSGAYVVVCYARVVGNEEASLIQAAFGTEYHKGIKGICQMPYTGNGGGYLIGIESFDNPNNSYRYEMSILDCTLLAQGKDAWIYSTGKCGAQGNCLWTVWQPQYGYYWTLFRVYDAKGNLLDERCFGFANIY
ncbi:MAG: DUF1542 domain-containing protein, partial [Lachnospiraceae bacterium]|nr:DUF1542 domain-containing protein [Lachnospiraceae bacterium]